MEASREGKIWSYTDPGCAQKRSSYPEVISGLLHALVALSLPVVESDPGTISDPESHEILPVACQWNVPCKRKESSVKISDLTFKKHVYGCQHKHTLSSLSDFDPRPVEYKGTAPTLL